MNLSDRLIKEKGRILQIYANDRLSPHKQLDFKFSNGWRYGFKQRNGFKSYRSYGEDSDADEVAIQNELPALRARLTAFALNEIFNADEFGLFHKLPPTTTVVPARVGGRRGRTG